jgi:[acyl-carrier-protein] S-malonyltransferase
MTNNHGDLRSRLNQAAFAFRGYNVTNLGRTPELLAHPAFGSFVETHLRDVSRLCSDVVKRPVDLVARVRAGRETAGLADYAEDVAFIVAVEIAQLHLLREFFGIELARARCAFGYSLGECAALIGAGVYEMLDLLRVPLALADDCAELAHEVTLAVLLSRGPVLDFDVVRRLCLEISQRGKGIIDIATYLAPNSVLLMGQNGTIGHFESLVHEVFPEQQVHVRRHQHRYPPLHTPIMWQRNIPNRTAVLLQTTPGGFKPPALPVLSLVTGEASYREFNSRELMHCWVDHPQRLWDIVYKVLADGITTVVHVGPEPNLLPATFKRLSSNVVARTNGRNLGSLGRRTLARLVRRPWLTRVLPSWTVLLRAPLVRHVVLEDWLLEQPLLVNS